MRTFVLVLGLALALGFSACTRTNAGTKTSPRSDSMPSSDSAATDSKPDAKVDFATQIKPILQTKCQPCHFSGGKVYSQMPFDRPETIKTLGTKLFTRIKDENERRLIREFLAQP